jgi:DNA (cytosine-5)-methyltransferase 1
MTYQEVARMQGFGDYQIDEIAGALKARDYKDATDLVIEPKIFYANRQDLRIQGDVINTLAARMETGGGNTPMAFHMTQTPVSGEISPTIGSSPGGMGMINRSVVRRLTPVECERLQGFPDQWTEGQADSHRYKQLGNAVAVPVVQWIIERFIQATN